jgi:hypothetical protein
MTTQTLRGMAGAGPMHWRGDRTGASTGGDSLDEDLAFKAFNRRSSACSATTRSSRPPTCRRSRTSSSP